MLERQKNHLNNLEGIFVKILYVIFFIIYNLFEIWLVYLIGKYSNRVYELIFILICFFINKSIYGKPLHFRDNFLCLGVSLILFYVAIQCAFTLHLSIIINIIIGVLCGCFTSYVATYLYKENEKLSKRNKILKILNNNTSQEYIFEYCKNNGLKQNIADTIDLFLSNTMQETSEILDVDISTIKRRINYFIESANK